jgi:hypothetical protein
MGLRFVDHLGVFFPGKHTQVVTTGGHTAGDGLVTFPGVVALAACEDKVPAMLKFHGGPLGFYAIRRFKGDHSHGYTHLSIFGNGDPQ